MIRQSNHRWIAGAAVALSLAAASGTVALAQDVPQRVQRAAEKLFPDQEPQIQERRQVNGVQTYQATVDRDGGRETAVITENGDILRSSQRRTDGAPTSSVQQIADQLFNMPMDDYQAVTQTYYLIDANAGGRDYQVRIDATGRIRDAQTTRRAPMEDVSGMEKASDEKRQSVEGFVKQWNEGATINEVYQYAPLSDYYLVQYTTQEGGEGQIVLNENGRVYQEIVGYSQEDLPRAVRNTLDQVLEGANINNAQRATLHYYEFERPVGEDTLTLRIRPNGEVMQVISDSAEDDDRAVTASERQERRDRDEAQDEDDRRDD